MRKRLRFGAMLAAVGLVFAASPVSAQEASGAMDAHVKGTITDDNIAQTVLTINSAHKANAMLALDRAESETVKNFANDVATAHTGVNEQAMRQFRDLGIIPKENEKTKTIEIRQSAKRAELTKLSGSEFDRAYMANEVKLYEKALKSFDELLIPHARRAELKTWLEGVRPAFAAYLERAEEIQGELEDERTAMRERPGGY